MSLAEMGRDLRSRRRARGLTQAGLAEAVGTRPVMVGRWERGEAVPSMEQAIRLADVLDLDPAVAAGWSAVALLPLADPAPPPTETASPPAPAAGWRGWRPRLPVVLARPLRRTAPSGDGEGAALPAARQWLPRASYLDDPVEQRRYALRWALTLLVLGALAFGLVWALVELREGWSAFLDLFRGGPPGPAGTRALVGLFAI